MRRPSVASAFVFVVLLFAAAGCRGPRLRILNEQITAFDRSAKTMTWTATVENSAGRKNPFCLPASTAAYGDVVLQAYLVTESNLSDPQHFLGAAGVVIPGIGVPLGVGESETTTQSPGPFDKSIDPYTHLLLTAYVRREEGYAWSAIVAARSGGNPCKRFITTVLIPLP